MQKWIKTLFAAASATAVFLAATFAHAADKTAGRETVPPPLIRVGVLMVAMPEEKFITLLPDLTDKEKIEKIFPALLEAVKHKEMILEGYPFVITKSGLRVVTETFKDFRDFNRLPPSGMTTPMDFETRRLGVTLEVEARFSSSTQPILLNLVSHQVKPLKSQADTSSNEKDSTPRSGRYLNMLTTTSIALADGQHLFLSSHKLAEPEGYIEVVIVHAEIIPLDP